MCHQGASGITAAQLGKSAAGLAKPSPLKLIEEGVPKAKALAQLEQVGNSVFEKSAVPLPASVAALRAGAEVASFHIAQALLLPGLPQPPLPLFKTGTYVRSRCSCPFNIVLG